MATRHASDPPGSEGRAHSILHRDAVESGRRDSMAAKSRSVRTPQWRVVAVGGLRTVGNYRANRLIDPDIGLSRSVHARKSRDPICTADV